MSVIAVQSGVGRHVIDTQPEEAERALAAIETISRGALVEMRRLLGVLRDEGDEPDARAPAPGLADLDRAGRTGRATPGCACGCRSRASLPRCRRRSTSRRTGSCRRR